MMVGAKYAYPGTLSESISPWTEKPGLLPTVSRDNLSKVRPTSEDDLVCKRVNSATKQSNQMNEHLQSLKTSKTSRQVIDVL